MNLLLGNLISNVIKEAYNIIVSAKDNDYPKHVELRLNHKGIEVRFNIRFTKDKNSE